MQDCLADTGCSAAVGIGGVIVLTCCQSAAVNCEKEQQVVQVLTLLLFLSPRRCVRDLNP